MSSLDDVVFSIGPDGRHIILDEDEVAECHAADRLTDEDVTYIDTAQAAALDSFKADAQAMEAFRDALTQ